MYQQYPPPVYYPPQQYSGCLKFLLYALAFFWSFPVGIIIAIVFMSRPDPESKSLGNTCMIISIISMVFWCCAGTVAIMLSGLAPAIIAYFTSMPMFVMPFLGM
jgi:hypothetical protein